jgi:putative addiction module component (TIGR02574 family)
MKTVDAIAGEALALSLEERTELLRRLVQSLDDAAPHADAEDALADVIERRLADVDANRASLIDGKTAVEKARAAFRRRVD